MSKLWVVTMLMMMCGCGDGGAETPDAHSVSVDAPADAPQFSCTSPSAGTHKIFLAFEGITFTSATTSDAALNAASFLAPMATTAVIPAWKAATSDRATQIASIVCSMRQSLFTFDVELVTTRPATGDYEMIVFGGQGNDLGYNFGSNTTLTSFAGLDCMNANQRDVAWVAEHPISNIADASSAADSASFAVAVLGVGDGLAASKDPRNCMCNISSPEFTSCDTTTPCSFTTMSMIPQGGDFCTTGAATQDQIAKLVTQYGPRP